MDSEQRVPLVQDTRLHRSCPQLQPSGPWVGGSSCGVYGPPQPTSLFDAYVRIAALEKDLEHSRTEKATTELTVRHLASICAKGPSDGRNGEDQIATIMSELTSVKEDIKLLKLKAENTHVVLKTLFSSGWQNLPKHKYHQQSATGEAIDLIDLRDLNKESAYVRSSPDDTTLLDTSNVGVDDDHAQEVMHARHENQSEASAFSDSSYIHHFGSKDRRAPHIINGAVKPSIKPILHDKSQFENESSLSESDSDGFPYETSGSSIHPNSSSDSFATAYSKSTSTARLAVKFITAKPSKHQALGLEQWSLLAKKSAYERSDASAGQHEGKESADLGKTKSASALVTTSQGPPPVKPSWKKIIFFSSEERRHQTALHHKRSVGPLEYYYPDFFKYGIRFEPEKHERDIYRTILISELPANTTLRQLLSRVRGGVIIDAKLLDTMKIVGAKSALVTFLHEHAALNYEEYAKTHGIIINNSLIKIAALPTPTFPMRPGLRTAAKDHQHTRCLEVHSFPRGRISELKLRADLRLCPEMREDRVVHVNLRKDGILELHFSSINYAGRGFAMLNSFKLYSGCKARFVKDPCAQPVETLNNEVKVRG